MSWGGHSTVRSDAQGVFAADDLPPGTWTVMLRLQAGDGSERFLEHPDALDLAPGESAEHHYAFHRRTLTLRILSPDTGEPLADTEFLFGTPGDNLTLRTDAEGLLRLDYAPMTPFTLVSFLPSGDRLFVRPLAPPTDESESVVEITATRGE